MLLALGLFSAVATVASELPLPASIPLATLAVAYGALLALGELRRPAHSLIIPLNETVATIDGDEMTGLSVRWRGPLAFLQWRDPNGRRNYLHGWPDNLNAAARRELRLAMVAGEQARPARSVAP